MELRFLHAAGGTDTVKARQAEWSETSDEKIPDWGANLHNPRSRLAGKVRDGDEVEVWIRRDAEAVKTRVFVGLVGTIGQDFRSGKLSDYDVGGQHYDAKLQLRHVTRTVNKPTDVGALIHEVMTGNDIGLSLAGVANPYGVTVDDVVFNYVDWHEFLTRLSGAVGAGFHTDKDRVLNFYPRGTVNSGITEDGSGIGTYRGVRDSNQVINVVRGFGGTSKVLHASQTTQTALSRVTVAATKTVRVLWPKEELPLAEVWCKSVAGSNASLEVRLESDNAGAPSGVPLARYLIAAADLPPAGGYATVFFPKHSIGPGTYVHIILQATDPAGVDAGVDGSGALAFKAYVGYPVASEKTDATSIALYGRREGRALRDSDITSLEELDLRLQVTLTKFANPLITGQFDAFNLAYLTATLGQYITVNLPEVDPVLNGKQLALKERRHLVRMGTPYDMTVLVADGEREREMGNLLAALLRRVEYLESSSLRNQSNVLQLLTASDSVTLADVATVTVTASGSFAYGQSNANYGFADYG